MPYADANSAHYATLCFDVAFSMMIALPPFICAMLRHAAALQRLPLMLLRSRYYFIDIFAMLSPLIFRCHD